MVPGLLFFCFWRSELQRKLFALWLRHSTHYNWTNRGKATSDVSLRHAFFGIRQSSSRQLQTWTSTLTLLAVNIALQLSGRLSLTPSSHSTTTLISDFPTGDLQEKKFLASFLFSSSLPLYALFAISLSSSSLSVTVSSLNFLSLIYCTHSEHKLALPLSSIFVCTFFEVNHSGLCYLNSFSRYGSFFKGENISYCPNGKCTLLLSLKYHIFYYFSVQHSFHTAYLPLTFLRIGLLNSGLLPNFDLPSLQPLNPVSSVPSLPHWLVWSPRKAQ